MISCSGCGSKFDQVEDIRAENVIKFGMCHICLRKSFHVQQIRQIASNLRAGDYTTFDVEVREQFAAGPKQSSSKFIFNDEGFGFLVEPAKGMESEVDWLEWGSELYMGPKSFNRFSEIDRFKHYSENAGIDYSLGSLDQMSEYEEQFYGHFMSEQEIGFVITTGFDHEPESWKDTWLQFSLGPKPTWDQRNSGVETPYYGHWHVHELNRLFGKFHVRYYNEDETEQVPAGPAVAEELEGEANFFEQVKSQEYFWLWTSTGGYNESHNF